MALHLAGWYQSVDQGAAAADIDAMADETLFASGDIVRVPGGVSNLAGAAYVSAASTFTTAQVQAPSLRSLANFDALPANITATPANPPALSWMGSNPLSLTADESMTFNTNTDNGGAVGIYGFVWLSDGALPPANGEILSVRATAAITLAAGVWTNGNLTFGQDLPYGDYDVVGMRVQSTNLIAARLVFPGGRWRPGALAANTASDVDSTHFRHGASGVLGSFNTNSPPSLDAVGVSDSAEVVILDLIKTG